MTDMEIDWKAMDGKYRLLTDELPVCSNVIAESENIRLKTFVQFDYDPISGEYDPTSEKFCMEKLKAICAERLMATVVIPPDHLTPLLKVGSGCIP